MSRSLFPSSLVQPLIVSLLPLFLLIWNLDTDWKKAVVHQQEVFREMTNRLQVRVRRLTSPEFWPEHWTRRLSTRLAQTIEQHSSTEHIEKLVQTWKTQVASGAMVWVATCASDSDRASLLLEGGTGYRKVWSDLFHFLFACFKNPIELALSREQHNLIRGLFGDHFPVSLLAPEMRGRPFPVLFRGSSFWLCWELLFAEPGPASGSRKRRLLGGVIVMFPQQQLQYRQVMELVLRRWRAMVPEAKGVECAFLPLPVKPGPLMEPPMGDIRWLQGVVKQRMVSFLRQLELKGSTNGWIAGDPVLPGSAINDILDLETHWGRVLPAAPILGHAVMLCGPKRAVTEPMRAILARWVFAFWLIGWLVVFVFRWWFGRFPDPGIRLGMQLWFLGLLAVPLILMVLTANNWLLDYRSNLLLAKRQEMEQVIAQIEAGTRVLNEEQTQLLNRLSTSPDLGRQLKEVEEGRLASAVFMDHFLESVLQSGLDPGAIFFYGHGGFEVSIMRRAHIVDQEIEMRRFVSTLAEGLLQHADPELAREYRLREERRNVAGAKKANPFQGLSSNPMTYLQIGSTEEFRMGRVSMMKFHSSIRWQGRVHYCLFVFWSFDRACRVFLKSQIPKMNIAYRDLGIAAYRELQDGVEVIFEPRVDESMQRWAELAREQPVFREQDGMLVLAVQSRTLPGYLLVVRGSLDGILQAVQTERFRLLMAALLLAFMVALSGYGLSTWLSDPILQMTLAIQKIAGGNLDIRVTEPRPDELGSAGESIDQMTRQLQERRRMSRFVAPQVLELTASGALNSTMQANQQTAVLLVSDIRDFTTISETQSPETVFSTLNTHFQVMARAIRSHGGVIDRFLGDAVQAVFYGTEGQADPATRAIRAAADMMRGHHLLAVHRQRRNLFAYEMGVGIDAGDVVSGVVGDPTRRLDFMVLGDVIKQAAELEALTKKSTRTRIVCSGRVKRESVYEALFSLLDEGVDAWELGQYPEQTEFTTRETV